MGVFCLFSLASCSIVKEDTDKLNGKEVLKIGEKVLTKGDVISGFYTYYQNNSNYFAYYDNETIENSFYQWLIIRQLISDMAEEALYNKDTNPDGTIYYTKEDEKEVWDSVLEYFYNQVNTKETAIYESNKDYESEEEYPIWIRTSEDEEEEKVFKPFESSKPEIDLDKRKEENLRVKLTEDEVKSKISSIEKYLREYVPDEDDKDVNDDPIRVAIDETNYISGARESAILRYKADLVATAKNNGTTTDLNVLFENEVIRVYEAYYSSKLTTLFQNYFINEYLTNFNGDGDSVSLGDAAIVEAFINQYYTDKQSFSSEKEYMEVIGSSDGASLILYHYNGVYYYFSVQHILVAFPEFIDEQIKNLEEYNSSTSNDYQGNIAEVFRAKRKALAEKYSKAMLTKVSDKNDFKSIALLGDYYFYDEELKNEYTDNYNGTGKEVYGGYVKLSSNTYDAATNTIAINKNSFYSEYDESEVVLMATEQNILDCYSNTFDFWKKIIKQYIDNEADRAGLEEKYPDMKYVFDVAMQMKDTYSLDEIYEKAASLLFVELEWIYSSDSLDNEISNKIGYIISSYNDENGSLVVDFANGARELANELASKIDNGEDVSTLTKSVISNYGTHIMKVENVYECGSSAIDIDSIIEKYNGVDYSNNEFVAEVVGLLKTNYVSTASNETLFDYFYEKLYTNFAGSSSSSGTYFLSIEYKWLSDLYVDGKIEYIEKLDYDALMDSLS